MENLSYLINDQKVNVQINRTSNKYMYFKIKNNHLVVSAPHFVPKKEILKFIEKNIEKFVIYLNDKKSKEFFDPLQGKIFIKGKKFNIIRITGFSKPKVEIFLNNIVIKTNNDNNEIVKKTIKNFLKSITKKYILKRQRDYEILMDIPLHDIKVSHKETNWGSNNIGKNKIIYASRLGHYSEKVIDYVIVHELIHYKHPNHSKEFWNEVKLYMPNYKEIKKLLKRNSEMEE